MCIVFFFFFFFFLDDHWVSSTSDLCWFKSLPFAALSVPIPFSLPYKYWVAWLLWMGFLQETDPRIKFEIRIRYMKYHQNKSLLSVIIIVPTKYITSKFVYLSMLWILCRFRVLAVDHDLLSFVDARLGDWPLILVTNPKDAQFLAPHHEPTESIKYSTHIRSVVTHNVSASQCPQIPPNTPYTSGGNPSNTSHTSGQWLPTMSVLHSLHKFHQTLHTHSVVIQQTLHTHQVSGHPQCQCFTVSTNSTKHSTHIRWSSSITSHTSGQWSPTLSVLHSQSAGVH